VRRRRVPPGSVLQGDNIAARAAVRPRPLPQGDTIAAVAAARPPPPGLGLLRSPSPQGEGELYSSTPNFVSREAEAPQFGLFIALLLRWNRRINLISRADETFVRERHIDDSAQLAALIPPGTERAIDLGSGAGFPGLILAAMTGIPFDLIEADQRKAAFLMEAGRLLAAPVRVHAVRVEAARLLPAGVVTARALAPLPRLLALAAPLLAPGGICLFPKGAEVESELTLAAAQWHMRVDRIPSRTDPRAAILRITELQSAPNSA
jgi:16S rRNA (guanine527-N7)-methyltransferase